MNTKTFNALQDVISQLFESSVNNIQDVISETEDLEFFDSDKLMQEADYITNLQSIKNQLDYAKENDEIESFEPNLKFLKGDFTAPDLVDMLGEENASEVSIIWKYITGKKLTFVQELDAIGASHLPVHENDGESINPLEVLSSYINSTDGVF